MLFFKKKTKQYKKESFDAVLFEELDRDPDPNEECGSGSSNQCLSKKFYNSAQIFFYRIQK